MKKSLGLTLAMIICLEQGLGGLGLAQAADTNLLNQTTTTTAPAQTPAQAQQSQQAAQNVVNQQELIQQLIISNMASVPPSSTQEAARYDAELADFSLQATADAYATTSMRKQSHALWVGMSYKGYGFQLNLNTLSIQFVGGQYYGPEKAYGDYSWFADLRTMIGQSENILKILRSNNDQVNASRALRSLQLLQKLQDNYNAANPPISTSALNQWMTADQSANNTGLLVSHPDDTNFIYHEGNQAEWAKIYANTQAYTYDQALAGISFLKTGNTAAADKIFNFFDTQIPVTGFDGLWTVYNVNSDVQWKRYEWRKGLGENAWLGLFMLHYAEKTGSARAREIAITIAKWITTLPKIDGALAMSPTGQHAGIVSTENNLDALSILHRVKQLPTVSAADKASFEATEASIKNWVKTKAYDPAKGLFLSGGALNSSGVFVPNTIPSLDVNAWAISALGPQYLDSELGIDIPVFVSKIEQAFLIQKNGGGFGGDLFTSKGFDFSTAENAARIGRGPLKSVEVTNQMILSYKILAQYFANNNTVSTAYLQKAAYLLRENGSNRLETTLGTTLTYADQVGVTLYAHTLNWKTFYGGALPSAGWVALANENINPFFQVSNLPALTEAAEDLRQALVANTALLNAFKRVYGNIYVENGDIAPAAQDLLNQIVSFYGYNKNAYTAGLTKADSFISAVESNTTLKDAFNYIYGFNISQNPRDLVMIGKIFDLTNSGGFNQSNHLALLPTVSSFVHAIRRSPASLNAFNTLFNQNIPTDTGRLTDAQIGYLFDGIASTTTLKLADATAPNGLMSTYETAAGMFVGLRNSPTLRASFKNIYGIDVPVPGDVINLPLRVKLIEIAKVTFIYNGDFTPYFNQLNRASAALNAIRLTPSRLETVNIFFNKSFTASGPIGNDEIKALFENTVTETLFNDTYYYGMISNVVDLWKRLHQDMEYKRAFELIYMKTVPSTANIQDLTFRQQLIDMVNYVNYPYTSYPGNDQSVITLKKAAQFLNTLRLTDKNRLIVNALFGTLYNNFAQTGFFHVSLQATLLSDIASGIYAASDLTAPVGQKSKFEKAYDLFQAIKGIDPVSLANRSAIADLYAIPISNGVLDLTTPVLRVTLINIGLGNGYELNGFLKMAKDAQSLLNTLKLSANSQKLAAFNNLYDWNFAADTPLISVRDLAFGIVSNPNYIQSAFLNALIPASSLLTALRLPANINKLATFNAIFQTKISNGALAAADRGILFDKVGDLQYNQTKFLAMLENTYALGNYLIASSSAVNTASRTAFNALYGTGIQSNAPLTAYQKTIIFSAVSQEPSYTQTSFLNKATSAYALYNRIKANASLTVSYQYLYGSLGTTAANQRQNLFNITGYSGYTENNYIRLLPMTEYLLRELRKNSGKLQRFNQNHVATLNLVDVPTPKDSGVLFQQAGDLNSYAAIDRYIRRL